MMPSLSITEFAPAKVNLTLHVTGQREDGYHLLDSLVVFCGIGDRLAIRAADQTSFSVTGLFADGIPSGAENLVMRAAMAFAKDRQVAMVLEKNLPPVSGIGGGSADAAAAIRAILRLDDKQDALQDPMWRDANLGAILALGADVPVCLSSGPTRMRGVGERLDPAGPLPEAHLVLVNPLVAVPTRRVFAALISRDNAPMPDVLPIWPDAVAMATWLAGQRNDLEAPARTLAPVIDGVLDLLTGQPDALFARMSGSGATCFAVFATALAAADAADAIRMAQPDWWTATGPILRG
jgi:4-diphosphocytidyl-2-C-methyl-D-erythritol kinase